MAPKNRQVETLLSSINSSVNQLRELEETYKNQKALLSGELASSISSIAKLADTQAVRAVIVRELYWNPIIPAEMVGNAFGLRMHRLVKIAGPLSVTFPCQNNCGGTYEKSFSSRSEKETYTREAKGRRARDARYLFFCEDCERQYKAEEEAKEARKREYRRLRDEQLRNISWNMFTESREWVRFRNRYLYDEDYSCEGCRGRDVTLHIHLDSDAVQGHPDVKANHFSCTMLCTECKDASDQINKQKGEVIKAEFLSVIKDWNQEHYYSSEDD